MFNDESPNDPIFQEKTHDLVKLIIVHQLNEIRQSGSLIQKLEITICFIFFEIEGSCCRS